MARCRECDKAVYNDDTYCHNCGSVLDGNDESEYKCRCNADHTDDRYYCHECGGKL